MMIDTPTYIILGLAAISIGWSIVETIRMRRQARAEEQANDH